MKAGFVPTIRCITLIAGLALLAGCDDNGVPGPGNITNVNVLPMSQAMDTLRGRFFDNNTAIQTLEVLLPLMESAVFSSSSSAAATIPDEFLGKVFVFNAESGEYEVDDDETGAPANGTRFLLYAVDQGQGAPVIPLLQVGHYTAVSNAQPPPIDLTATIFVDGESSHLELSATGSSTEPATVGVMGDATLTDSRGDDLRLDFELSGTSNDADFTLTTSFQNTETMIVAVAHPDGAVSLTATVTNTTNDDELRFVLETDAQGAVTDGSHIFFNEIAVAVFSGSLDSLQLSSSSGTLTQVELDLIVSVFDDLGVLFQSVFDVTAFSTFFTAA